MTAVVADGVTVAYPGGVRALDRVSLTLRAGEITTILGPNGAGKSTLLRALAGLTPVDEGHVHVEGRPMKAWRRRELAKRLAIVLPAPEAAQGWTAFQLVLMGRTPHLGSGRWESKADVALAHAALARVDARSLAGRAFGALSAGERQRVMLARAICQAPRVLLLDEPTSHLDPRHALMVARLLRELADDGVAIAWALHDLNLAARAADSVALMAEGRMVHIGSPDDALTPARLSEIYGVVARRIADDRGAAIVMDAPDA